MRFELRYSRAVARTGLLVLLVASCAQIGCTRRFFRNSADREVEDVLTQKNCYPDWRIEQFHVYPDERSRFADPSNPDRPPMPPDDPAAKCMSPNPQHPGKSGCGSYEGTAYLDILAAWDGENRAKRPVERPDQSSIPGLVTPPRNSPPPDERLKSSEKAYLITVEQACELALLNSREFQDRREDLFLAALPVTLERFAFATQFFATEEVIRESTGSQTPEGKGNRWRSNSDLGFSKLFPTGALLLVRLANQVVVNMSDVGGPRVVTPASLSLDLTQPMLRGGGFPATLEPLTQTERNLLYVIRGYAHFRKEFYVFIAGSGIFGNNFTPTGPLAPSGTAANEGFYLTVLRGALLENARLNVRYLESIRALFGALLTGGDVSQLQVDQVELDLLNGRANVLLQTQQVRDALDRFKIQLGVPTSLSLELDDASLRPLITQQGRFLDVVSEFDALRGEISRSSAAIEPEQLRASLLQWAAKSTLVQGTRFVSEFPRRWRVVEALTDDQLEERRKALDDLLRKARNEQGELQRAGQPESAEFRLQFRELERDMDLVVFEREVRDFLAKPWLGQGADPTRRDAIRSGAYRSALSAFVVVLSEARNERIEQVKQRWPSLPPTRLCDLDLIAGDFDEATAAVSQAALANRLDLMNARARVVDSWRKVAVRANSLMGVLDVRYHLDTSTPAIGTQPFDFDASRTRHQLAFNGELPLVRKAERNEYRTALIAFQRSRRTLQAAEDLVLFGVRSELRQLRVLSEQYKIQQRAVELSYYQVENSLNVLQAPPRPSQAGAGGTGSGGSSGGDTGSQAALTRQLLDAVRGLLQAQNQLYTVYQNYSVVRMQLYRDLELMPLDARGVWIDEQADLARSDGPQRVNRPADQPIVEPLPPAGDRPAILPPTNRP